MEAVLAIVEALAAIAVFGILLMICLYGWFVSNQAYLRSPSTFARVAEPEDRVPAPDQRWRS